MDFPTITLSSKSIRQALTNLINEYIRIEKTETGLSYQKKTNFVRGQIALITSLIKEDWKYSETETSYYNFLKYIVEKYQLSVWKINDLK